jgi:glycosyltransferase involved in cell wall biosynthesis
MKRICFLTDSIFSFGGVQRVTAVIAKELAKDYEVTIVTLDNPKTMDTTIYNLNEVDIKYRFFSFPQLNKYKKLCCKAYSASYRKILPHNRLTSNWYSHSSFPSELRNALCTELYHGNYDIIIGDHAPLAVRLASCKPYLGNTKLIGWIHNSYEALFGKKSLYIGSELKKFYEYQLEILDSTIVLSQYDAQQYHFPTKVIYNPLTLTPSKKSEGTSKKFLAVGRFSRLHKGFDLLIEAFRIFANKESSKEWTLDIVGEGVEEPLYRQLIKNYKLEDRITIHPFTNYIQQYYSDAQVYVLSSRWEGFGLVLVEAMAHGLPVISSDLPTSKEIMGDSGLYFRNGDANGIARQMEEATKMDWLKKSGEALEIAKRFRLENIIEQWRILIDT